MNGKKPRVDGETAVLAKIAALPQLNRRIGERLHAVIMASAPMLTAKLWYGMPAYSKDGEVVCFFQCAQHVEHPRDKPVTGRASWMIITRYATLGFANAANLDDGGMWPVGFAIKEMTPVAEAKIAKLVKKAVREHE